MAEYTLQLSGSEIDARLAAVPNAVNFTAQNLTDAQKVQARTNISAGDVFLGDVVESNVTIG